MQFPYFFTKIYLVEAQVQMYGVPKIELISNSLLVKAK